MSSAARLRKPPIILFNLLIHHSKAFPKNQSTRNLSIGPSPTRRQRIPTKLDPEQLEKWARRSESLKPPPQEPPKPPFIPKKYQPLVLIKALVDRFLNARSKKPPKAPKKYNYYVMPSVFLAFLLYKEYNDPKSIFHTYTDPTYHLNKFYGFTLVGKEAVSSTSAIFTLRPKEGFKRDWGRGGWSMEFKQPELMISRDYTPLPPLVKSSIPAPIEQQGNEDMKDLHFLIRKTFKGEVSSYLHNLPIGATVELRGPKYNYEMKSHAGDPGSIDKFVFLAGGTGIAPALEIANAIFNGPSNLEGPLPQMHIIWANRRREDCEGAPRPSNAPSLWKRGIGWLWTNSADPYPNAIGTTTTSNPIVQALATLQKSYPQNISVTYFIDEENTVIRTSDLQALIPSLKHQHYSKGLPSSEGNSNNDREYEEPLKIAVMVAGPDGFMKAIIGDNKVIGNDGIAKRRPGGMIRESGLDLIMTEGIYVFENV